MGSVVGPWQLLFSPQYGINGASASASPAIGNGLMLAGTKRPPAHSPSCADLYSNSARPLARPRLSDVTSHYIAAATAESEQALLFSWQHCSQELASPAAPAPRSASSSVSVVPSGAGQAYQPVSHSDAVRYGAGVRQHAWARPSSQAAIPYGASGVPVQHHSFYTAPSSSTATTVTMSAGCTCGRCTEATQPAPTASAGVSAAFHYHHLPQQLPLYQYLEPECERRYVQPSRQPAARAPGLLPPLALDRRQQGQYVHQAMPSQQQEQQQMVQVQVAAVYCPPTANEAAAPPAVGHVPSLNRPSCSSSYATTLYTTTSCAATSCDDDVTQCEPRYSSHHALAQMQLRMQELIQTLAPVVSTWQALGPQPAPEPQSCRCVHPPTHAPLDVFTGTLAPQQEVYDLPWLLTPLPPAPARAPGQPSRLQQVHPQHPQQQQPQQQQQELMRMQPLQSQQHEASSSYLRQMPTQSVSQLPLPQQCQQPAALSSHTLRHLLLQQQPQLQAHVQQQHSLQPQQGIVVLAAVSPSSRWQQQLVLQPVLQQPPSQSAQPREYQQASSAGARSRFPRPCLPVPAVNSPYEWIMHVCKALVLTPDTTGRLAAHIFHRVEDAIRLMVAVRPRVGQGRRDDGAGGPGDMAGAERVYGMAAIWIAAKLEERRREMPRASTLAAVVSTSPGVLAAVELRILQWVDWAPLGGFVPDDSHLLTWGNC